jgi:hypothetical protein
MSAKNLAPNGIQPVASRCTYYIIQGHEEGNEGERKENEEGEIKESVLTGI